MKVQVDLKMTPKLTDNLPVQSDAELIRLFERDQRRRGLTISTIDVRRRFLGQFLTEHKGTFKQATTESIQVWLDRSKIATKSRVWRVSTLHSFYAWALDVGYLRTDPTAKIVRPRVRRTLPRPIHDDHLVLALEQADPLMLCWLLLAALQGLRCREIAGLERDDVQEELNLLRIVDSKGGNERAMELHPDVLAALQALPMPQAGAVFRRPRMLDRYPPYYVSQLIGAHLRRVTGLEHIGAHQLRHWFGTKYYAESHDLRSTQEMLGHQSPNTTAIYSAWDRGAAGAHIRALKIDWHHTDAA
jgi:integrase/recombinase XerC